MDNQKTAANAPQEENSEKQKQASGSEGFLLLLFYITFCTSFLCAVTPLSSASVFSLMICICVLSAIYTYRVRGKRARNKLVIAHTTYMIRTFWRANILLAITSFIGLLYMLVIVNYEPFDTCTNAILNTVNKGHTEAIYKILKICGNLIIEKNKINLQIAGIIAFSPVFVYVLWHCVSGSMLLAFGKTQLNRGKRVSI